jgi:catechol 2,3-dioxygenase-like lactoylglutathione lyase family enzyme
MPKNWKFAHAALVVKDMDKAVKSFEALGAGPIPPFLGGPGMPFSGKTVRGKPSDYDMDLRLARGDIGGLKLELIQPLKGNSVYHEFLEEKGEGLHHLAFMVEDIDAEIADMAGKGFKVVQTGAMPNTRWVYLESREPGGMLIELCQAPKGPPH